MVAKYNFSDEEIIKLSKFIAKKICSNMAYYDDVVSICTYEICKCLSFKKSDEAISTDIIFRRCVRAWGSEQNKMMKYYRQHVNEAEEANDVELEEKNILRAEDIEKLNGALKKLPPKERKAVTLRVCGGLTYHQIGDRLGASHQTAANLYAEGLKKLKKLLN